MSSRHLLEAWHREWGTGGFVTARGCLADDLDFTLRLPQPPR